MIRSSVLVGTLALALSACSTEPGPPQYGADPNLPEPQRGLLPSMKIPRPANWGNDLPTVPEGYEIRPIATDLRIPRQTIVLPNGDILVAEGSGGSAPTLRPKDLIAGFIKSLGKSSVKGGNRLTLLRDADGDGTYEMQGVFADKLNAPYGLALVDGAIFVANQDALVRFEYRDGQAQASGPPVKVADLPAVINHHWTKALTVSADGRFLYVGIGSNSNITERGMDAEEDRAMVWQIDAQTGAHRPYATGLRNPTALTVQPGSGRLWAVVNERDEIGPNLVPDYLTSVHSRRMRRRLLRPSAPIMRSDRTWRRWGWRSQPEPWVTNSPTACSSESTAVGTAACRSATVWSSSPSGMAAPQANRWTLCPASSLTLEIREDDRWGSRWIHAAP